MLIACWSVKGGSGTTVVAAALALLLGKAAPDGALLVDLDGDVPAVLGLAEPSGPGVLEWAALPESDRGPLSRLEVEANPTLRLLPAGAAARDLTLEQARSLASALRADPRLVVVDCGSRISPLTHSVASLSSSSLLVIRPCYLALRRAVEATVRPTGVVLVTEAGRALRRTDVQDVLGVPVRAEVEVDPGVARSVDAGLLAARIPRALERSLRGAA